MGCPCIGLAPWEEKPNTDENRPNKSLAPCRVASLEVSDSLACRPLPQLSPPAATSLSRRTTPCSGSKWFPSSSPLLRSPLLSLVSRFPSVDTASGQLVDFRTSLRPDAITILGPSETDFW